ncbi:hypothetical protein SAMN04488069_103257 [Hymenobacter psychrophilus]|uniref:Secreted protein n=1 Tax=Hymenobacter psychrophilus TaxID=651662 RepID=A0A1H3EQP6_9BACT|nr:hypothetical protein SAMN04488069_103257 [Hymenobacter psychrophilus]
MKKLFGSFALLLALTAAAPITTPLTSAPTSYTVAETAVYVCMSNGRRSQPVEALLQPRLINRGVPM